MTENLQNHLKHFFGWGGLAMPLWDHCLAYLEEPELAYLSRHFLNWAKQYILISKTAFHKSHNYLHSLPLTSSWVCLRTDGSIRLDEGVAATGGYICYHNGGWIIGFYRYLGNCTVTEAEL
ncbi:hypothetical protein PVK06_037815 [Gossypium arboreum]|uniref:Uncharacterized protein n=1 Tax=Gossypium arboreum TaxID=29729 RepID=A0ABR0MYD6_GOSAR|nr:hypothetical protein PVK06_037815 [Gossypium arboreum]